ncbi:MAG: D-alanyl-D-alanine carboxypeptidase family protein [Clostridia bacterium]|nr:D-alanyl-D-alanine carboxypeptidase family protein [Clostridia bacterium]
MNNRFIKRGTAFLCGITILLSLFYALSFSASALTHYVQPSGASWNLRLVNKWNQMTQAEADALPISYFGNGEECDSRIVIPLRQMLNAASGYGLFVTSGYRSYSLQSELFENKIWRVQQEYGYDYATAAEVAATVVARPGTSEHNTGLAVDLLYDGCWELEEYWENGAVFGWLQKHCADYGFILRFPKGKQDITGVIYEPWHYRYVGVEAAKVIMSRGITLEEYLEENENPNYYSGFDYTGAYDYDYYVDRYPDLNSHSKSAAIRHFIEHGLKEGRVASPVFDVRYYKNRYPDLQQAYADDWIKYAQHFVRSGMSEGRRGSAIFDVDAYKQKNADLQSAFGNDLKKYYIHYIKHGLKEGRPALATDTGSTVYSDVPNNAWYYDAVKYVTQKGYMSGYASGKFGPGDNLQRQDFVVILANIAKANLSKYKNSTGGLSDVKAGSYYAAAVAWAVDNKIVAGYQNGEFGVGDPITREQVCAIFWRYKGSPTVTGMEPTLGTHKDYGQISEFAKIAVAWAKKNGVISGMADGRIAPLEKASRAQIAVIVTNMDKKGMF